MFNFNNNNKKNNSFTSDNLAKHYDNLKKDLKRASILFPSTEGRDEAEDEIKEWEKSKSKTNQDKKSSDKEWSQFLSLGDSELSPLLKSSLGDKYDETKQKKYLDKKYSDNFKYQNAIEKMAEKELASDLKRSKTKNVNKDKTLYDLQVEEDTLKDLASSSDKRIKEKAFDNSSSVLNVKKRDLSNEPYLFDSDFAEVLNVLFPIEGNYSNKKSDLGGPTNMGITQDTYNSYNKRHNIPKKDVKNITRDEAIKIYYDDYWKDSGASGIKDKKMALLYFDTAVNMGPGIARRFYRESNGNFDKFMEMRKNRYSGIIEDIPSQKANKKGWANRLKNLQEYVDANY